MQALRHYAITLLRSEALSGITAKFAAPLFCGTNHLIRVSASSHALALFCVWSKRMKDLSLSEMAVKGVLAGIIVIALVIGVQAIQTLIFLNSL